MLVNHPFTRCEVVCGVLLLLGGCAGPSAEMKAASAVAARAADCGPGILPEATLTEDDGRVRYYDVGCDFSLVKVTCSDGAGCVRAGPERRDRLQIVPDPL